MKVFVILPAVLLAAAAAAAPPAATGHSAKAKAAPAASGGIDRAVFGQLEKLGIQPAKPCTDEAFVRRVYLDVIGMIPSAPEVRMFLADTDADKRGALIDRLLQRREFADYWTMKWCDLLRVKAEFPITLWPNATQAYFLWIRKSVRDNKPYDQFLRELITSSGSNFRVPPVNFYRALQGKDPGSLTRAAALTFMGTRAEKWDKARFDGVAVLFSQVGYKLTQEWKEEVVYFDTVKAAKDHASGAAKGAVFPDGTPCRLSPDKDPREVFADWLIRPENPWFTRAIVNRAWFWLVGRGVVHEPDDIRPDNPPSNPQLLAALEKELLAGKYDLKHLFRAILNSRTYQQSSVPQTKDPRGAAQFAFYSIRRLEAEVLIDALCLITGTTESYESRIPEPFTFIPADHRSVELPDGSITSPFLEMFGRPSRDTGLAYERNNKPTAAQRLHLLNSTHIRTKIENSAKLKALMAYNKRSPQKAVSSLYLTILSRYPTPAEYNTIKKYLLTGEAKGTVALADVAWALLNSSEFLYRH